jgi:carboxyl-terminal processing protease
MWAAGHFAAAACTAQLSVGALKGNAMLADQCRALGRHLLAYKRISEKGMVCASRNKKREPHVSTNTSRMATSDVGVLLVATARRLITSLAALLLAACLQAIPINQALAFQLSSATEDRLLQVVRNLETQFQSSVVSLSTFIPNIDTSPKNDSEAGRVLIDEIYDVVSRNFLDARGVHFSPERWREVRDRALSRRLNDMSAVHAAVREMVTALGDPYSRFLTPREFSSMVKYDVSGVGLNLGTLDDLQAKTGLNPEINSLPDLTSDVWVIGIIRGSAAEQGGMRQGDRVLQIGGVPLERRSPFEVASLFANGGDTRSVDALDISKYSSAHGIETDSVDRDSIIVRVQHLDGRVEDVEVQRPKVQLQTPSPVIYHLEKANDWNVHDKTTSAIGYLKLKSFNARAQADAAAAIENLQRDGATRYVIDLRGNRGGLVTEGVEVARLFLGSDAVVVKTLGKQVNGSGVAKYSGNYRPPLTTDPVAVLVDGHTASAAEIFAGAIQDSCRGVLVGQQTYGKGLIQSVYELSDGSGLVLTVGKYLTPAGRDIDWNGLTPDFGTMPTYKAADEALTACRVRSINAKY